MKRPTPKQTPRERLGALKRLLRSLVRTYRSVWKKFTPPAWSTHRTTRPHTGRPHGRPAGATKTAAVRAQLSAPVVKCTILSIADLADRRARRGSRETPRGGRRRLLLLSNAVRGSAGFPQPDRIIRLVVHCQKPRSGENRNGSEAQQ